MRGGERSREDRKGTENTGIGGEKGKRKRWKDRKSGGDAGKGRRGGGGQAEGVMCREVRGIEQGGVGIGEERRGNQARHGVWGGGAGR